MTLVVSYSSTALTALMVVSLFCGEITGRVECHVHRKMLLISTTLYATEKLGSERLYSSFGLGQHQCGYLLAHK